MDYNKLAYAILIGASAYFCGKCAIALIESI